MKSSRSLRLLAQIRAVNKQLKRLQRDRPLGWKSQKSAALNYRAALVVEYIKSLRIKVISVEQLKSLLL